MAKRTQGFDFVTVSAETANGMNISDTIHFHLFNPRGVLKTQRRIDDAIRDLVDAGTVKSGAHLAYGSFDSYCYNALMAMGEKKPSGLQLDVILRMYEERNKRAAAFVVDNGGRVAGPVIETVEAVRAKREAFMNSLLPDTKPAGMNEDTWLNKFAP